MATFSVTGKLIPASTSYLSSSFSRPPHVPCLTLKCSSDLPSRDTEPSSKYSLLKTIAKPLALLSVSSAAAASVFLLSDSKVPSFLSGGGGGGGGRGSFGGFGGGGGDGNGGGFWRKLFSPAPAVDDGEEQSPDWDSHGFPANITLQLKKLSAFKKYKVSEITMFDRRSQTTVGTEDPILEMLAILPRGVYTKAQLHKVREILAATGMFENIDLEGKTKPDGTLGVTVSFAEHLWQISESFRCINIGPITDEVKLPSSVHRDLMKMLKGQEKVSGRLLLKIKERVQKWYHGQGYVCALLVNFRNLNTKEMVFELVEGDITQLRIQFHDELGNVVEDTKNVSLVLNKLPKKLRQGYVYNSKDGKQALRNINSLGLFSSIEVNPCPDEKNEGGIIVEITLTEHGTS